MSKRLLSLTGLLFAFAILAACSIPRGAALQSEVLSQNQQSEEFAVYPVTRSFLPVVAGWPKTGTRSAGNWISHKHNGGAKRIGAGDAVDLTIWENEENSLLTSPEQKVVQIPQIRVSSDGTIFVPYTGKVDISGLTEDAARNKIQGKLEAISPSVQVQLVATSGHSQSVSLVGGVASPGSFPVDDAHFTVLNLISMGGGVSASLKNPYVKLIRKGRKYSTSLERLYDNPDLDTILKGGDKIIVEKDRRYFRSLGAVSKEQIIPFEQDKLTALDAMAMVEGLTDARANPKGILVLREYAPGQIRSDSSGPQNTRSIFTFDLTSADGLFSAGRFQMNSQDTILVTESSLVTGRTVLGLVAVLLGLSNQLN